MLELTTQAATLEEETSVAPISNTPDYELHKAVISGSTGGRNDQLGIQQPTSDILVSLGQPSWEESARREGMVEIQEQSRTVSAPARASGAVEQKMDRQSEETIKEHVATSSSSESNGGLFSSFSRKARNALSAIIPEPVREAARSIDRKVSEVLPVWNDIKAWVSDAFESLCDFLDDVLSEEITETTMRKSSSQSGNISRTYEPIGDINQSEFASVKDRAEEEQLKQELRKALQGLFYDTLKSRKDEEELLLNERLKEAMNKMFTAVDNRPDKQEKEKIDHQLKENNYAVDTHEEKQELIEKIAAEREIDPNTVMNSSLRELFLEKTSRELELFGFTQVQAEALIEAAVRTPQTVDEEHTEPS